MSNTIPINEQTFFDRTTGTFLFLPEIIDFSSDRTILTDSTPATVKWNVRGATKITINDEPVSDNGQKTFHTADVLNIHLQATNSLEVPVIRSLMIRAERAAPVIEFFCADRDFVIKGMPVRLTWAITGAKKIEISNGVGDVTGRSVIDTSINSNGVFHLTASNHFGDKSFASASVTVFPTPVIDGIFRTTPNLHIKPVEALKLCLMSFVSISDNFGGYTTPVAKQVEFEKRPFMKKAPLNFSLFQGDKFSFTKVYHKSVIPNIKILWKRMFKARLRQSIQQN